MSGFILWKAGGVVLGLVFVVVMLKILLKLYCSTSHFKKSFAQSMDPFTTIYNAALGKHKERLFSHMRGHLEGKVVGDVLEIGSGTGANLEYIPGVSLVALDPNTHMEKIFRANAKKFPAVKLQNYVVGKAEDLRHFEEGSLAAVFCTITLCSVPEHLLEKALREIKRVLKPGGRFYFLEHVAGEPGTSSYYLQKLMMLGGFWKLMLDGCCCDRQLWHYLHKAGFSTVSYKKFSVVPKLNWSVIGHTISPHLVGYAETFQ